MRIMLALLGAWPGLALAADEAAEVEDFEQGFGDWQALPHRLGPDGSPGWSLVIEDADTFARNQPTNTWAATTWMLRQVVDLTAMASPRIQVELDFHGHRYSGVEIQVGPPGPLRTTGFTTVARITEPTEGPLTVPADLSAWAGEAVAVRVLLSKPSRTLERRPGLSVHRITIEDTASSTDEPLLVGAFNIQVFGVAKMDRPGVPEILADVVQRYDLLLIQEIRDLSGASILELLALVNAEAEAPYAMVISDRLGRTSSKEQYAFLYRPDRMTVLDRYHYDDGIEPDEDLFEREPFVVRFLTAGGQDFAAVALHADPDEVPLELEALYDVQLDAALRWDEPDLLLMGDLNADCSYLSATEQAALSLVQDGAWSWWIDDHTDTTVSSTQCAYDRILTAGALSQAVLGAGVHRFDLEHGLDQEQALQVSDHYPVEIEIED